MQRIKSDAELYAVLSKRRLATDEEDAAEDEPPSEHSSEMKGLLNDITKTFGGEQYSRTSKQKPRFQRRDDSESNQISEGTGEDDDQDEEAPTRRPSRRRGGGEESGGRKQTRGRRRDWSESEDDSDDSQYEKEAR